MKEKKRPTFEGAGVVLSETKKRAKLILFFAIFSPIWGRLKSGKFGEKMLGPHHLSFLKIPLTQHPKIYFLITFLSPIFTP